MKSKKRGGNEDFLAHQGKDSTGKTSFSNRIPTATFPHDGFPRGIQKKWKKKKKKQISNDAFIPFQFLLSCYHFSHGDGRRNKETSSPNKTNK